MKTWVPRKIQENKQKQDGTRQNTKNKKNQRKIVESKTKLVTRRKSKIALVNDKVGNLAETGIFFAFRGGEGVRLLWQGIYIRCNCGGILPG